MTNTNSALDKQNPSHELAHVSAEEVSDWRELEERLSHLDFEEHENSNTH